MAKFDLITSLVLKTAGYEQGIDRAKRSTQGLQQVIKGVAGFATGFLTLGAAVAFAKKAIDSSSGTADKFERVMQGVSATSDRFFNMVSTADFSNLISNLREAAEAGMAYADAIDEIVERKLGLDLEKSVVSPYMKELEATFRDNDEGALKRQEALNVYKANAVDLGAKAVYIANAAVIAEEELLKGKDVEAQKLKELYTQYNTNISTIQSANSKTKEISDLEIKHQTLLAIWKESGAVRDKENADKYKAQIDGVYSTMTEDEKYYADLLKTNDKVKEEDLLRYITVLKEQGSTEADLQAIDVETMRVKNRITKAVEDQLSAQKELVLYQNKMNNVVTPTGTQVFNPNADAGKGRSFSNINIGNFAPAISAPNELVGMNTTSEQIAALAKKNEETEKAIELQEKLNEAEERRKQIWEGFQTVLAQGADSYKDYVKVVKKAVKEMIGAMIAEGVTAMILSGLKTAKFSGPAALIIAPVLAALGAGIARTAFNSLIPSFATGGISAGGMALVGEQGPELVNLPSGSRIFSNSQSMGMMGSGDVVFQIKGDTLVGVLNNHNRRNNSYR